ncbi:MAG: response regulator transcription factor [Nitrospira sp.]
MPTKPAHSVIRVIPVDDSLFCREGLRAILQLDPSIQVVGEATSKADALLQARRLRPHVVVMDVRLSDGSGIDACREILSEVPETRILFLSAYSEDEAVYQAIMAGGHGYLTKDAGAKDLLHAIKTVATGRSPLGPSQTANVIAWVKAQAAKLPDLREPCLTDRDRTLLQLLAEGKTTKVISAGLQLEAGTVTKLISALYRKLGVRRRTEAVSRFIRGDWSPSTRPRVSTMVNHRTPHQ